ncbi:MAG: FGGY-family carbohydrate kinase [Puniceicoccaceae bacterium]
MTVPSHYIGIDVGTGSARAGVFTEDGRMLAHATAPISRWTPQTDFVQQSSSEIWNAVSQVVRESVAEAGIDAASVKGIGFDATCSLVVLDADFQPVSVSPDGEAEQDIIMWMDHRAKGEADFINGLGHEVLKFVGGRISPEMQTPKLLWLKKNMPETWEKAAHFMDLPDYLTFKATGDTTRSLCSTVCKMTYLGHEDPVEPDSVGRWDNSYFEQIGLEDMPADQFKRLGTRIRPMGEALGTGLSEKAAEKLGLELGAAVSVSIIDAHAGGVGMLSAGLEGGSLDQRIALITGTSACHMAVSPEARYIDGVWGPYYSAMVPGMWLTEGGQSAVGSLVDHVVFNHGATAEAQALADEQGVTIYEILNDRLEALAGDQPMAELTTALHVCPYFHGNRSPRANPHLVGMISGLKLSASLDDLALLYLATIQAIAYGTRHIIEALNEKGYAIDTIVACGGGTKNPVFLQQHADISGCRIVLPKEQEAVLLGSAMLGAAAAGTFGTLQEAMEAMSAAEGIIGPDASLSDFHRKKYAVFHRLYEDQLAYEALMQ